MTPSQASLKLNESYVSESKKKFFTQNESDKLSARSVLIDMESKVVNKLVHSNANLTWLFKEQNCYTQKKGSGNNWSYGYCVNGPKSLDRISDIIRKEVEACDRLSSFMVCMSLAGGTGSGVGSYYTEVLRDLYPRTCIINNVVWPFSTGEVTLQNYNFLLTLNKLYQHSDGIIVFENDNLHQICKRLIKTSSKSKNEITFDDLNNLIGHKLASVLQPCQNELNQSNYLDEIITDMCPTSDFKLLSLNNVPQLNNQSIEFSSFQWSGLYKHARQLLFTGGFMEEGLNWNPDAEFSNKNNKTLSLSLFARGNLLNEQEESLKEQCFGLSFQNKFFADLKWRSSYAPVRFWSQARKFNRYEKSLTLLSNSQMPVFKIDSLVDKAWNMFSAKAYVHQYVKYGNFEEEELLNAFIFTEQLIKNYKNI